MTSKGCGQKSFMLLWSCHQFLSGFLANCHLPRLSIQWRMSDNGKCNNDIKTGVVNTSPGILLTTEKNIRKTSVRRSEVCVISNHLKWGSFTKHNVDGTPQRVTKGEGTKERWKERKDHVRVIMLRKPSAVQILIKKQI